MCPARRRGHQWSPLVAEDLRARKRPVIASDRKLQVLRGPSVSKVPKSSESASTRQMVALRPPPELRAQLEQAAEASGRPISKEAEWRLSQSFVGGSDPLPGIFSDEVRRALRGSPALARIVEAAADVLLNTIRAANSRGRDEIEVRTAARAALNALADHYLWRGEEKETPIEGPLAPLGTRPLDYPPAHMGYEMAHHRILYLSSWHDDDAATDKAARRIRDIYSGTGRTVLMGPSLEEAAASRAADLSNARAGLAAGEVQYEDPARLPDYKPVRAEPPQRDEEEGEPPQSLRDIMGR